METTIEPQEFFDKLGKASKNLVDDIKRRLEIDDRINLEVQVSHVKIRSFKNEETELMEQVEAAKKMKRQSTFLPGGM